MPKMTVVYKGTVGSRTWGRCKRLLTNPFLAVPTLVVAAVLLALRPKLNPPEEFGVALHHLMEGIVTFFALLGKGAALLVTIHLVKELTRWWWELEGKEETKTWFRRILGLFLATYLVRFAFDLPVDAWWAELVEEHGEWLNTVGTGLNGLCWAMFWTGVLVGIFHTVWEAQAKRWKTHAHPWVPHNTYEWLVLPLALVIGTRMIVMIMGTSLVANHPEANKVLEAIVAFNYLVAQWWFGIGGIVLAVRFTLGGIERVLKAKLEPTDEDDKTVVAAKKLRKTGVKEGVGIIEQAVILRLVTYYIDWNFQVPIGEFLHQSYEDITRTIVGASHVVSFWWILAGLATVVGMWFWGEHLQPRLAKFKDDHVPVYLRAEKKNDHHGHGDHGEDHHDHPEQPEAEQPAQATLTSPVVTLGHISPGATLTDAEKASAIDVTIS